jgi:hypothetical protein
MRCVGGYGRTYPLLSIVDLFWLEDLALGIDVRPCLGPWPLKRFKEEGHKSVINSATFSAQPRGCR